MYKIFKQGTRLGTIHVILSFSKYCDVYILRQIHCIVPTTECNINVILQQIIAAISVAVEALHAHFGSLINKDSQCPAYTTIDCFKIFNHDTWPENKDILLDYGSEQVDVLLNHFQEVLQR